MNLVNTSRSALSKVPGLNKAIDFIVARANAIFGVEHDNETGVHTNITAESITVSGGIEIGEGGTFVEDLTTEGDLKALTGTTEESGLGILNTVNGSAFMGGEVERWGLLIGGPTNGFWLEVRGAVTPFNTGYEFVIWDLSKDTTKPAWRLGSISGTLYWLRGGSGAAAVGIGLNDSTNRLTTLATIDLWAHNGLTEYDRAAKLGDWTSVSFNAANFTASAGNWTLASGDQATFGYELRGKTLTVAYVLVTTTVSATPATLRITIPGGFTAARRTGMPFAYYEGTSGTGIAEVVASGTTINLTKDIVGTAWATTTDNTYVEGVISFEVQ